MKPALVLALAVLACGDPGRTEEVKPRGEGAQITGGTAYSAALQAYGRFDDAGAVASLQRVFSSNPNHPRALASALLFDVPTLASQRAAVLKRAQKLLQADAKSATLAAPDRALLRAAVVFRQTRASVAARALQSEKAVLDHELAFWASALAYRAGDYEAANRGFYQVLQSERSELHGRIYDHYVRVLLHFGRNAEALTVATQYRALLPKRVQAARLLVRALIATSKLSDAAAALKAVVTFGVDDQSHALHGRLEARLFRFSRAASHYTAAAAKAPPSRRGFHLAALALVSQFAGDSKAALAAADRCVGDAGLTDGKPLCLWLKAMTELAPNSDTAEADAAIRRAAMRQVPDALVGMLKASRMLGKASCFGPTNSPDASTRKPGKAPATPPAGNTTDTAGDLSKVLSLLRKAYRPGSQNLPGYAALVLCHRAGLKGLSEPSAGVSLLDAVAETHPILLLAHARLQRSAAPAKSLATLNKLLRLLGYDPKTDDRAYARAEKASGVASWAANLRKQVQKLNVAPKQGN